MSLDISLTANKPAKVYDRNITHNLGDMARAAGIYHELWRPDELGFTESWQLIKALESGLKELRRDPGKYKVFNPGNGFGDYQLLVLFVEDYLAACKEYPEAIIEISR